MNVSRNYFAALSAFTILLGLSRLVLAYHDYFADDTYDMILWLLGSALLLIGLTILCFTIERYMFTKTRKAITITGTIIIVAFLLSFNMKTIATVLLYAGNILLVLLPFFIYVYIAKISTGSVRTQALIIITGIIIMLVGQFGGNLLFLVGVIDRLWSQIMGVTMAFVGMVVLTYGFAKSPTSSS